jgi:hypothetical protein
VACWANLCCTKIPTFLGITHSHRAWQLMLPASAAVESVTTQTYPHVFKIFSIHLFSFYVYYFQPHVVKTTLGEGLVYYINRRIILHRVIWRRAECKLVKYVGLQMHKYEHIIVAVSH